MRYRCVTPCIVEVEDTTDRGNPEALRYWGLCARVAERLDFICAHYASPQQQHWHRVARGATRKHAQHRAIYAGHLTTCVGSHAGHVTRQAEGARCGVHGRAL